MLEQERTISSQQSIPILPITVRHELAKFCITWHMGKFKDIPAKEKRISRKNRYTGRIETYTTERPDQYVKNPMVRLLDIWCRMRAYVGKAGHLPGYSIHQQKLAAFCECSINKLRPAINQLHSMGWITLSKDADTLSISSEKNVYALCGLDYYKKIDRIFYKPIKRDNEKTTFYWIYLADISDNRQKQGYVVHKEIMSADAPEERSMLEGQIQSRNLNLQQTLQDPMAVCSILKAEYIEGLDGMDGGLHSWLVNNRPDVNRGVNGMGEAWGIHPMNVSYIKKQINKQVLAVITKIGTISSPWRARNPHIHIATVNGIDKPKGTLWNKRTEETFQAFCDDIEPRKHQDFENRQLFRIKEAA